MQLLEMLFHLLERIQWSIFCLLLLGHGAHATVEPVSIHHGHFPAKQVFNLICKTRQFLGILQLFLTRNDRSLLPPVFILLLLLALRTPTGVKQWNELVRMNATLSCTRQSCKYVHHIGPDKHNAS